MKLDGANYELAAVTVATDGAITNEYVKEGESIDKWTTRLTVRLTPSATTINAAINPWLQSIRGQLTRKWEASRTPNARSDADVIVETWRMAAAPGMVEASLNRFVAESGTDGIKTYVFTEQMKSDDAEAAQEFHRKSFVRSEALAELAVPVKREK